ncbi:MULTISPECIES: hypothetical protein [unclassified Pseudodesulfovibrio]|uniref:hypothetical protein n=1 Tax=unclassified Pseudodesulfovibrio TaxID=2661612 RepID=UPI000FEC1078|nr:MULTISPECIES: hypothetical protein [unclassified Pseudodesulfovibrio]MCJ2164000.1 hypothetical protein [Pseudodesulfovibrio sp. S3-i]RWU05361.1 hypothetical protein DWB63_06855 [Pseudodesulfovibrio sp. S3]
MKEYRTAIILIASAAVLGIGAYLLLDKPDEDSPNMAEVVQPVAPPAQAPDWVNKGQDAKPDYAPSTAESKDTTPPAPVVEQEEPQTIEVAEDKMITFTFVESLADYLLHRFQPRNSKGKPDSLASIISLNKYYGRELDGFAVTGDDIQGARKIVLDYAFNPAMLETLYNLYAQAFMVHLVDTAANSEREYVVGDSKERRTLTNEEIQSMLRLNSRRIERTAELFQAIADDPGITEMAAKYRRASKAVERANSQLQTAISDEKNTAEAGERLKQAILLRERTKAEIVTHLKQVCQTCTESEVFYLSQWAYRRVLNEPEEKLKAFGTAAKIMEDLAGRFNTQADALK